jgi:hypothetical protein
MVRWSRGSRPADLLTVFSPNQTKPNQTKPNKAKTKKSVPRPTFNTNHNKSPITNHQSPITNHQSPINVTVNTSPFTICLCVGDTRFVLFIICCSDMGTRAPNHDMFVFTICLFISPESGLKTGKGHPKQGINPTRPTSSRNTQIRSHRQKPNQTKMKHFDMFFSVGWLVGWLGNRSSYAVGSTPLARNGPFP